MAGLQRKGESEAQPHVTQSQSYTHPACPTAVFLIQTHTPVLHPKILPPTGIKNSSPSSSSTNLGPAGANKGQQTFPAPSGLTLVVELARPLPLPKQNSSGIQWEWHEIRPGQLLSVSTGASPASPRACFHIQLNLSFQVSDSSHYPPDGSSAP